MYAVNPRAYSTSSAAHLLIDRAQALPSHPQLGVGQVTPDLSRLGWTNAGPQVPTRMEMEVP